MQAGLPEQGRPETRVQPSAEDRNTKLFGGVACLALAVAFYGVSKSRFLMILLGMDSLYAGTGEFSALSLAVLFVAVALVFTFLALRRSWEASCPGCGTRLQDLSPSDNGPLSCPECHRYVDGTGGRIGLTDQDAVRTEPTFESVYAKDARFPERCCLCGAPPTRHIDYGWTSNWKKSSDRGRATYDSAEFVARVPYCSEHQDAISIIGYPGIDARIFFRAYAELLEFCKTNKTQPGPSLTSRP